MAASTKTWLNNNPPSVEDDDLNGFAAENNNLILGSGQALSTSDSQQTHKAVSVYAHGGNFYTDGGAADAYVLAVVGTKVAPPAYFVGMTVKFVAGNDNTGASTINIATLGVKNLLTANGSALVAGDIILGAEYEFRYNGANFVAVTLSPYPLLPTETGVTNVKWPYGSPRRFGAVGDGTVEDGPAWRNAALSLPANGGVLRGHPGDIYLMEGAVSDPYTAAVNAISVLFQNKSDITIILEGCVIKQTVATSSTTGVFTFDTCTNCKVLGGTLDGYWDSPGGSANSGAMVAGIGLCDRITVECDVIGGRAIAVFRSSDGTSSGVKPINTIVRGNADTAHYGVNYTHCGFGHQLFINTSNQRRCVYITGTPGVTGVINSFSGGGADLNISTRDGGDIKGLDIVYHGDTPNQAIEIKVEDAIAANITDIKISGTVRDCVNDAVAIKTLGHVDTVIRNIDLSGLRVIDAVGSGINIDPDVAGTISTIKIGDFQSQLEAVKITNDVGATIEIINMDGKHLEHSVSPAIGSNAVKIDGLSGTVDDISMIGTILDSTTTGGQDVNIKIGDGVAIDGCVSKLGKEIRVVGSVNVKPGVNDHNNRGFVRSGALTDGLTVGWADTLICTTGSATVNNLNLGVPGQKLTLVFTTGTPTIVESANIKLQGAGNFVATVDDVLELVCIDPPSGGPLAVSSWQEVSRSVN